MSFKFEEIIVLLCNYSLKMMRVIFFVLEITPVFDLGKKDVRVCDRFVYEIGNGKERKNFHLPKYKFPYTSLREHTFYCEK